jgi:O-antigen ligase
VSVLRLAERGFVVLSYLLFTDAISPVVNEVRGLPPNQTDPITKILFLGIQTGIILLIVVWWKRVVRIVIKEKFLWVFLGITLASVFWSTAPGVTLQRVVILLRATLFGVYLAARYSLKEQLQFVAWALGIAAVLSLMFVIALPSYGVMGMSDTLSEQAVAHAGAWRGVYIHKNPLGRMMVLSAVVFLHAVNSSRRYRWVAWAGFGLSVLLILGSTSKSALLIVAIIISLLPFYRALRWNYTFTVPFFIIVILLGGSVAVLLVGMAETILGALGRDLTFTGRTPLWAAVMDKIWERPWLGYGYGGFWQGWSGESAEILRLVRWATPHSHNGFLDVWLDLGLIGLLAFAISFLGTCLQAVTWVRKIKTGEGLWPLAYLTFLLLYNLTESSLLRQNSLWLLYVAVTMSMHNKSLNLEEPQQILPPEFTRKAMKQITPGAPGRRT